MMITETTDSLYLWESVQRADLHSCILHHSEEYSKVLTTNLASFYEWQTLTHRVQIAAIMFDSPRSKFIF